jgi:hypothetical protein
MLVAGVVQALSGWGGILVVHLHPPLSKYG